MLALTADNATSNDTLTKMLAVLENAFHGESHRGRCFLHITNLIANSLLRQFDANASSSDASMDPDDDLRKLAKGLETEEMETIIRQGEDEVDNIEGWRDELEELDAFNRDEHHRKIYPVKKVLAKVSISRSLPIICCTDHFPLSQLRRFSFAVINSTTILLPKWLEYNDSIHGHATTMPRDIRTRWNSTYDMLDYAIDHRKAVDAMTGDRSLGLRAYELEEEEWKIVDQLRSVLQVRHS